MKYHYTNEANEAIGPVEESKLHELFSKGEIKRDTNILPEGADAWHPFSKLLGVMAPPPLAAASPQHAVSEAMQRCPYCSEHVFATAKKWALAAGKYDDTAPGMRLSNPRWARTFEGFTKCDLQIKTLCGAAKPK